jgi:hypothetical protein
MHIVRTIHVPSPIAITVDGKPVVFAAADGSTTPFDATFSWFVLFLLNRDTRFNNSGQGIKSSWRIEQALKADVLQLEAADWELLRAVADEPDCGQPRLPNGMTIGRQLLPFLDAISTAKEEAIVDV